MGRGSRRTPAVALGSRAMAPAAQDESNPLLPGKDDPLPMKPTAPPSGKEVESGGAVEGMPVEGGSVMGRPVERSRWDSGLFSCLGRNDEFCSSDLEVCILGSLLPCVLHGSNVERLSSAQGTFASHCMAYTGLYMLGNMLFGCNALAPAFSYRSRTAMRRMFNLEGSCEAFSRTCGCCGGIIEDDERREKCETLCDFATHYICHLCALCQEGRELRRKLPHPGFNGRSAFVMVPPLEQTMARGA